ncbi:MAG: hypothetical protein QHH43_06765 [Candidatus Saccharicenans sp.]|nr:hypothetical protein [Candidatus Saccharicenans sp.]MDH7575443.1 hypothetical protein [Candidatus Saccharicenans sp.]
MIFLVLLLIFTFSIKLDYFQSGAGIIPEVLIFQLFNQCPNINEGVLRPADFSQVPVIQGHVQPAAGPVACVRARIRAVNFFFQNGQRILVPTLQAEPDGLFQIAVVNWLPFGQQQPWQYQKQAKNSCENREYPAAANPRPSFHPFF